MQNKSCKAYLNGIRDLRAMIKREGGSTKSSSKRSKKVATENLKEFRRLWLNLMRERDLMRTYAKYTKAELEELVFPRKAAIFHSNAIKYAKIASDFKERGLIESY